MSYGRSHYRTDREERELAERRADACRRMDEENRRRKKEKKSEEKREARAMRRIREESLFKDELKTLSCLVSTAAFLKRRRGYWEYDEKRKQNIFASLAAKQDTRYLQLYEEVVLAEHRNPGRVLLACALEESKSIAKALRDGNVDVTKFYLERGLQADTIVNRRLETYRYSPTGERIVTNNGPTAIRETIEGNSIDTLDLLLEANSLSGKNIMDVLRIGCETESGGECIPILTAVKKGYLDVLARLYLAGANLYDYALHALMIPNLDTLNFLAGLGVITKEEFRYINGNFHFLIRNMIMVGALNDEYIAKNPDVNLSFMRQYLLRCDIVQLTSLTELAVAYGCKSVVDTISQITSPSSS